MGSRPGLGPRTSLHDLELGEEEQGSHRGVERPGRQAARRCSEGIHRCRRCQITSNINSAKAGGTALDPTADPKMR